MLMTLHMVPISTLGTWCGSSWADDLSKSSRIYGWTERWTCKKSAWHSGLQGNRTCCILQVPLTPSSGIDMDLSQKLESPCKNCHKMDFHHRNIIGYPGIPKFDQCPSGLPTSVRLGGLQPGVAALNMVKQPALWWAAQHLSNRNQWIDFREKLLRPWIFGMKFFGFSFNCFSRQPVLRRTLDVCVCAPMAYGFVRKWLKHIQFYHQYMVIFEETNDDTPLESGCPISIKPRACYIRLFHHQWRDVTWSFGKVVSRLVLYELNITWCSIVCLKNDSNSWSHTFYQTANGHLPSLVMLIQPRHQFENNSSRRTESAGPALCRGQCQGVLPAAVVAETDVSDMGHTPKWPSHRCPREYDDYSNQWIGGKLGYPIFKQTHFCPDHIVNERTLCSPLLCTTFMLLS